MSEQRRPDQREYFLSLAFMASTRGTCPRRRVGAVLVSADKRVISTGYNGAPPGMQDCLTGGCVLVDDHCVNSIHAEANALLRARELGTALYCTDTPCINCFKAALSHHPTITIYHWRDYHDPARDEFIRKHGLQNRLVKLDTARMTHFADLISIYQGDK